MFLYRRLILYFRIPFSCVIEFSQNYILEIKILGIIYLLFLKKLRE